MREILFRAKAINRIKGREYRTNYKNGDWVYGLYTKKYNERFEDLPAEFTNENGISGIDVDYKTIGQFTGLTDKNGTKIFEGDILKYDKYATDVSINVYEVVYDTYQLAYIGVKNRKGSNYTFSVLDGEYKYFEVIGNIHDNPELLNGGDTDAEN